MAVFSMLFLLLSNAVTFRREKSILYSRETIIILLYCFLLASKNLTMAFLDNGIGLHGCLFHATSILTLIMSSVVNSLVSAISIKIKGIIISTFTSTSFYKTLKSTYYKGGLFSLLNELATLIYYITTDYIHHNLYYMIGFQCFCIYQALLGYEL